MTTIRHLDDWQWHGDWSDSKWGNPVDPDPIAVKRWARYCTEIDARIAQVRLQEGHEGWQTFGTDMLDFAAPIPLPVGRVGPLPPSAFGQPTRRRTS